MLSCIDMEWIKKNWIVVVVVLTALLALSLVYAYNQRQLLATQQAQLTYERQMRGQLDDKEREIQALNTELGLTQSQLISQAELEKLYVSQLSERDAAMEAFRKEHDLQIASMTNAIFNLENKIHGGKTSVGGLPVGGQPVGNQPVASASQPASQPLSYTYTDKYGRVALIDPDIYTAGNEDLILNQFFMLNGKVFRQEQKDGFLRTEKLDLTEIVRQPDGSYAAIGTAKLVSAKFSYADPAPVTKAPKRIGWDMSVLATVGTTFVIEHPLAFGGAVNIARWKSLGVAVGVASDFASLGGTALDVLATYRPAIAGRDLNLMVGVGAGFPLGGVNRIVPTLAVGFVLW
jgi:hypothetical protein